MKLFGKNPVLERLKTNPQSIQGIYIEESHPDAGYVRNKAKKWGIAVAFVPRSKMMKMTRTVNAQGVFAEVADFGYVPYDDLLKEALAKNQCLLFLDNLNDPQNLGAIIRSVACLGGFAIVLPRHDSVEVTEAVLKVASGGDNYVSVSKVSNLGPAITAAKEAGFWIAGTVVEGGQAPWEASLPFPLGIVMGSEQKGIREILLKHLDIRLTVPMSHPRLSLNVAQATTIFCYEIIRQKAKK